MTRLELLKEVRRQLVLERDMYQRSATKPLDEIQDPVRRQFFVARMSANAQGLDAALKIVDNHLPLAEMLDENDRP